MSHKDLKKMVGRECEFLSYYLEEFEKKLTTDPRNQELKDNINTIRAKWEAYDKVYRYIIKTFEE
jgi:hypothetical protein